ncbi:maternal B9.10 protein-like [Asterias amurensis]|uniref:maternal B9.10 protein-like n=1 Tax=Asterias amurensis TaxID=7602 RepID=UPI003AB7EF5C
MKDEIAAAVVFLTRLINLKRTFTTEQMSKLSENLVSSLIEKFRNHWYEEKPSKGQAFRCIRIAKEEPRDAVLARAAKKSGLKYDDMSLPTDFTLWVDPLEVVCRFGEKGTICPIAEFPKKMKPVNDNEPPQSSSTQSSDDNGNVDTNANPKSVVDSIHEVLQNHPTTVNDNAIHTAGQRRGRKQRAKNNYYMNNAINAEKDWPALSVSRDQYHWVNKSLAVNA